MTTPTDASRQTPSPVLAPAACTFALFLGNRGFFPSACIAGARDDLLQALATAGHRGLCPPEGLVRHGAVETAAEGRAWARWFAEHKDQCDGVILCLPNFGDETGAVAALQDCGMPILVQAYPDELDRMGPATRRDAFCGGKPGSDQRKMLGFSMITSRIGCFLRLEWPTCNQLAQHRIG